MLAGRFAGQACCGSIEFCDAVLGLVEFESGCIGTKAIGQNDVCARLKEGTMQPQHLLRFLHTPKIWRVARLEAAAKKIRAGGAVCNAPTFFCNDAGDGIGHVLASLSVSFWKGRV